MIPAFIALSGLVLLCILLGMFYQRQGTRRDARNYPPPGRLVDLGTHRLHLVEAGFGDHTIVMEAGLMSTSLSWMHLQNKLSRSFRTVSYDRAGLGWSELGPMSRTADRIADELHSLLNRAGIPPPYILLGHSFGGLTAPIFAARFPDEVAGMVLVDPVAAAEWNPAPDSDLKLARMGADVCRRAALLARVGIIRLVAALVASSAQGPGRHLVRLITRGTPADSGSVSSPWFFALPAEEKVMAGVFWSQPKFALTIASQLENLPLSARQVAEAGVFCQKPVAILSARSASDLRRQGHTALARSLPLGEQLSSKGSHWIMQEEPDLVVRAIEKIAASSRRATLMSHKSA